MSAPFFAEALSTVAHYWRIYRRDGVALGFVTHDRDLTFGGLVHCAAPGLTPSAIRLTGDLSDDEAAIEGALSHRTIRETDLAVGRYDGAEVELGVVDWQSLRAHALYTGSIQEVTREGAHFSADLVSRKADFDREFLPRTGPTCRARFCETGCDLNPRRFESRFRIVSVDRDANLLVLNPPPSPRYEDGAVRFLAGPQAGQWARIISVNVAGVIINCPIATQSAPGTQIVLREGCDKTIATCAARFSNAANFRGEPHLPGADLLTQYPTTR